MDNSCRTPNIPPSLPPSTGHDVSSFNNNSVSLTSSGVHGHDQLHFSGQGQSRNLSLPPQQVNQGQLQGQRTQGQGWTITESEFLQGQGQVQYRHHPLVHSRSVPYESGTSSSLPTLAAVARPPSGGSGILPSLTSTGVWSAPCTGAYPAIPPRITGNGAENSKKTEHTLRNSGSSNSSSDSSGTDYTQILNSDEGWDLEFVPARSEKHDCPICLLVLREPVQTECGHRFCRGCILKWLRESDARCPVDNQPLEEKQLFPDNFAKREILALTVKCVNHTKGCDQIVVLKHLQNHLDNCVCSLTPCPNECASVLLRGKLSEHLLSQCPKRIIQCSFCQSDIVAEKEQFHFEDCPQCMISCSSCGAELKRQQLLQHLNTVCSRAVVKCQYNLLGCPYEGERQSLEDHEKSQLEKHMGFINLAIVRLYALLGVVPTSLQPAQSPSALGHQPTEASSAVHSGAASFPSYFVNLGERMNLLQQLFQHLNISPSEMSTIPGSPSLSVQGSPVNSVHQGGGAHLTYSGPGSVSIATGPGSVSIATAQNLGRNVTQSQLSGQNVDEERNNSEANSSNRTRYEKVSFTSEPSNRSDQEMPGLSVHENQMLSIKCQNDIQDESLARHDQQLHELSHQKDFHEKLIRDLKMKVKSLESTVQDFEGRCGNGTYVWKIKNYFKQKRDAERGEVTAIHSSSFYSGYYGYKLCIRVNLNGVDSAKGTHLSLFVHFMQGDYDDLLEWPFSGRIVLTIIDQNPICELRNHISETLTSKPNLAAFQRPVSTRNHKGFGYMEFLPLSVIDGSTYIRNDTLIIKANIIPTSL